LDYSLYTETKSGQRKALKNIFCDPTDSSGPWLATLAKDKENLDLLALPEKKLAPAKYRTYFAPAAASDLVAVLSWSALSLAAYKQKRSPFKQLIEQQTELSPKINLIEDFKLGLSPRFNFEGELAPENLPLIEAGKIKNLLVNQAAAKEHGAVSNGADVGMFGSERLRTAVLASGNLPEADILQALDTGIYVNNLHYLNWSNLHTASITGMTRYACFWVENGKIVSPITDLRFDDSFYNFWGPQLLDLTEGFEIQPNTDTYVERSLGGSKVPGVLVKEFNFVL
jgi:predicted Zn-dependent protease